MAMMARQIRRLRTARLTLAPPPGATRSCRGLAPIGRLTVSLALLLVLFTVNGWQARHGGWFLGLQNDVSECLAGRAICLLPGILLAVAFRLTRSFMRSLLLIFGIPITLYALFVLAVISSVHTIRLQTLRLPGGQEVRLYRVSSPSQSGFQETVIEQYVGVLPGVAHVRILGGTGLSGFEPRLTAASTDCVRLTLDPRHVGHDVILALSPAPTGTAY